MVAPERSERKHNYQFGYQTFPNCAFCVVMLAMTQAAATSRHDGVTRRPSALLAMGSTAFEDLFDEPRLARLARLVELGHPAPLDDLEALLAAPALGGVEVLVTGWGGPPLDARLLASAPRLRAVVHTGGSVKHLVTADFWDRGVVVTSAADANAIPVAEFTVGTVLLEAKRVARYAEGYARHREIDGAWRDQVPPAVGFGGTVGIVGLSRVGRRVAELLRPYDFDVLVHDPHTTPGEAAAFGARQTELDPLLRASDLVSLHAPALPETRHLLDARRLALLREDAVLINTARGSLVDTDALVARCRQGTLRAILDVTDPEPLPRDSPLFTTPGVVLTPHVAGAVRGETHRLADAALGELERLAGGRPLRHRVDRTTLAITA